MRFLVFNLLLCGVTAQARQEGSASASVAAWRQQISADKDAVAELVEWIVAAGGEARPRNPAGSTQSCCLPQEDQDMNGFLP